MEVFLEPQRRWGDAENSDRARAGESGSLAAQASGLPVGVARFDDGQEFETSHLAFDDFAQLNFLSQDLWFNSGKRTRILPTSPPLRRPSWRRWRGWDNRSLVG